MKALVFTAPGLVEVLDVDEPTAEPDEALVSVESSGICGSELHGIQSVGFRVPPLILGHEFIGRCDGARVAVNPVISCGTCVRCVAGEPHLCSTVRLLGGQLPGGSAERVAVPRSAIKPIPEDLSLPAASLIEPLANAVHALELGGVTPETRLGILGAGTIGLVCLIVAKHLGVSDIQVTDLSADRLAWTRRLGASATGATLQSADCDVIIDAVGAPATHLASLESLRAGGTAVWVGLLSSDPHFDAKALVRREQKIVGSFAYTDEEFAHAVSLAGAVDAGWVTEVPLERSADVFLELAAGRSDLVKVVVVP